MEKKVKKNRKKSLRRHKECFFSGLQRFFRWRFLWIAMVWRRKRKKVPRRMRTSSGQNRRYRNEPKHFPAEAAFREKNIVCGLSYIHHAIFHAREGEKLFSFFSRTFTINAAGGALID
jgi:hypothetical protein